MFDLLKIRTTLKDARTELDNSRKTISQNKLRIEELKKLPLPRDELVELAHKFIDDAGSVYPQKLAESLKSFIQDPIRDCKPEIRNCGDGRGDVRIMTATEHNNGTATTATIETALFYLLKDQLKAGVLKAVQEMEYPAIVGPAMSSRLAEIDTLTQQNVTLEAKVKGIEQEMMRAVDING